MGSLTSRPKIPQVQQQPVIIAAPPPAYTAPAAEASSQPATTTQTDTASSSAAADNAASSDGTSNTEAQRLAREDSLLQRSRGRLGTVLTGFTGLLSQTVGQAARKTLLGE